MGNDIAHDRALADELVSNGNSLTLILAVKIFVFTTEHVSAALLGQSDLALGPSCVLEAKAQGTHPLPVAVNSACDSHLTQHCLVEVFSLLRFAASHSIEIDVLLHLDDFAANKHALLLSLQEFRHLPGLFGPLRQPTLHQLLQMICRPLALLIARGCCVLLTEDHLEKEAEELARLLLVREQKDVHAEVVEVSEVLKVFRELLARLKSPS